MICLSQRILSNREISWKAAMNVPNAFFLKNRPTAIYSGNNVKTLGLLKYMCEKRSACFKKISLLRFDNIDILDYLQIPVSHHPFQLSDGRP